MAPWLLAGAAGALWVGILLVGAAEPPPGAHAGGAMLGAGLAGLAAMAFLRGRPLRIWVAFVIAACFVSLGAGWASLREARRADSPLARLAGRTVTVWGSMDGEPAPGPFGWTASVRAEVVFPSEPGWPGAVSVRDPLWVQGRSTPGPLVGGPLGAGGLAGRAA